MKDKETKHDRTGKSVRPTHVLLSPQRGRLSSHELENLVHELGEHQIELRMQNEELRRTQMQVEESRQKYHELFDFAPIGCLTLDVHGIIQEANLTAADLFKVYRRKLLGRGFRRFVTKRNEAAFLAFCRQIFQDTDLHTCELILCESDGTTFQARLSGIKRSGMDSQEFCQIAVSDISDLKEAHRVVEQANETLRIGMEERAAALSQLEERREELKHSNDLLKVEMQERKRAEEQASRQSRQMEGLSRRLLKIQEAERHRLALDLHDELGQVLTGIRLNLQQVQRGKKETKTVKLREAIEMLDGALSQVRRWSFDLRPPLLDDLGLVSALRWYVDKQVRGFVIEHLRAPRRERRFPSEIETTCFRVAQEALTNVIRHAKAKNVWIEVSYDARQLQLRIRDDGVGFDVVTAQSRATGGGSLGLLGMNERVRLCGGRMEITSSPAGGATVLAFIPLNGKTGRHNGEDRRKRRR